MLCKEKRGMPRHDHLCGCRRAGRIERQSRVRRDHLAVLVAQQGLSGEHHPIIARQRDAARSVLRHVRDLHAADRVTVPLGLVGTPEGRS